MHLTKARKALAAHLYGTIGAAGWSSPLVDGRGYGPHRLGRTGSSRSGTGKNVSDKGRGFSEMHLD